MDQHPVPQNISSYEFRLVGDMTLKQFFYVAGGLVIAFVFYKSPLPGIISIPIAIVSALTGALAAFVPVNGRPFSQWLVAFFKAVYSPTKFYWKQSLNQIPPSTPVPLSTEHSVLSTGGPLDRLESDLLSRFTTLFTGVVPPQRNDTQATQLVSRPQVQPQTPPPPPPSTSTLPLSTRVVLPQQNDTRAPAINPTPVEQIARQTLFDSSLVTATPQTAPPHMISSPTHPNVVAGVVVDSQGKTLEGVIIEIIDNRTDIPVRAFRTNKLGQFQSASPLTTGPYTISAEKEGFSILPVSLAVDGTILPPIIIKST